MARGQVIATTPMAILATTTIGALMYLIVIMFVPFVAGSVEMSIPANMACKPAGATGLTGIGNETFSFNRTCNPNLTNPATTWTTIAGFLQIAAIFAVMSLVFLSLRGMI